MHHPALPLSAILLTAIVPAQLAPLVFEPNRGQIATACEFLARSGGVDACFTGAGMLLRRADGHQLNMQVRGAFAASLRAEAPLPGVSHYLRGNDPAHWLRNVPHAARLRTEVRPGITLVWHARGSSLEYDFEFAAGTAPESLVLEVGAGDGLRLGEAGQLLHGRNGEELVHARPIAWQLQNGVRRNVDASFRILDARSFGFAVGPHDPRLPLTIDPVLAFGTFLGGAQDDVVVDCDVDPAGNIVVGGSVATPNATGSGQAWVAKLSADGSTVLWSTTLGGSSDDQVSHKGVALDSAGRVFLSGLTMSADFPVTAGARQTTYGGAGDAFVAVLAADGSALHYATYLGGPELDGARGMAIWNDQFAYVTGTGRTGFPVTAGSYDVSHAGAGDAFVAVVAPLGNGAADLVYSSYLGSALFDRGNAVAVDAAGRAHVVGNTGIAKDVTQFPRTPNAFQSGPAPKRNTFADGHQFYACVAPFAQGSADLRYAVILEKTLLTGILQDNDIAVDGAGRAHLCGRTGDSAFPKTANALQSTYRGGGDAYVMVVDPDSAGTASLVYSSFLGGSAADEAQAIRLANGRVHVAGATSAPTTGTPFPTTPGAIASASSGGWDAFLTVLDLGVTPTSQLVYSTLLGGAGTEEAHGVAVTPGGAWIVAGTTSSTNFPVTSGAARPLPAGGKDGFVVRIQ